MAKKKKQRKLKFEEYIAIIGILGFFAILLNSIFNINISGWVDGLLFIIIGIALTSIGGITVAIHYFKDGLDEKEITKILSIVVGLTSIMVGILIFPIKLFEPLQNIPIIGGVKIIISIFAIIVIVVDTWLTNIG